MWYYASMSDENPSGITIQETKNGIIVKGPDGRFLPGTRPANMITVESSPALHSRRRELKKAAIEAGAMEAIDAADFNKYNPLHGDLAWVVAGSKAMMRKALTVKDPKAVDAFRLLLSETGLSEGEGSNQAESTPINALAAVIMRLLDTKHGE